MEHSPDMNNVRYDVEDENVLYFTAKCTCGQDCEWSVGATLVRYENGQET